MHTDVGQIFCSTYILDKHKEFQTVKAESKRCPKLFNLTQSIFLMVLCMSNRHQLNIPKINLSLVSHIKKLC